MHVPLHLSGLYLFTGGTLSLTTDNPPENRNFPSLLVKSVLSFCKTEQLGFTRLELLSFFDKNRYRYAENNQRSRYYGLKKNPGKKENSSVGFHRKTDKGTSTKKIEFAISSRRFVTINTQDTKYCPIFPLGTLLFLKTEIVRKSSFSFLSVLAFSPYKHD